MMKTAMTIENAVMKKSIPMNEHSLQCMIMQTSRKATS